MIYYIGFKSYSTFKSSVEWGGSNILTQIKFFEGPQLSGTYSGSSATLKLINIIKIQLWNSFIVF